MAKQCWKLTPLQKQVLEYLFNQGLCNPLQEAIGHITHHMRCLQVYFVVHQAVDVNVEEVQEESVQRWLRDRQEREYFAGICSSVKSLVEELHQVGAWQRSTANHQRLAVVDQPSLAVQPTNAAARHANVVNDLHARHYLTSLSMTCMQRLIMQGVVNEDNGPLITQKSSTPLMYESGATCHLGVEGSNSLRILLP
ncbi:hypothetical protein L7F22_030384 [Adiantum nelumboides]|nr:hypothetical protein [Adiantum nelumboides]